MGGAWRSRSRVAHLGDDLVVGVAGLDPQQLGVGGLAEDVVDRQAGVALELGQGPRRVVAEDPVDPAGVEAERAQPLLELGHVVAAQHGGAAVEGAPAQAVAGLDHGVPGLATAGAVHPQPPPVLEPLDRGPGGPAEGAGRVADAVEAEGGQPLLEVGDRLARVALLQGEGAGVAYR